jgi:hypothetical protein
MIVFDLECRSGGHRFEGWFGSSGEYARQQERGLVVCPECGNVDVFKAPMAPNVGAKGNQLTVVQPVTSSPAMSKGVMPPKAVKMMTALAEMQAKALERSRWVGDGFAEVTREIHYGEREAEPVHGKATIKEAQDLIEEGIEVSPLPFPVLPPGEAN